MDNSIKQASPAAPAKMQVEIWSDVMCPFCYIGKRHFEAAMQQFEGRDKVEVTWKSFQLDPDMKPQPGVSVYDYLAERKGVSRGQSVRMHQQVTGMAAQAGLTYNYDKAVVANSYNAHRLLQLAKQHGLGDAAEEALFKAYFTDGQDTGSHTTLIAIGVQIGLKKEDVETMLNSNALAADVERDIYEAQQVGARGVPFFVMDRRYAVSGAQPVQAFVQTLQAAYKEWQKEHPQITITGSSANVCGPEGNC